MVRCFRCFRFRLVWCFFYFNKTPKKIFIQYSPVFVGFTPFVWAFVFKENNLECFRLWPLAGLEWAFEKVVLFTIVKMERLCYRNADLIVGQSEEILEHISNFEKETYFLYRNIPTLMSFNQRKIAI